MDAAKLIYTWMEDAGMIRYLYTVYVIHTYSLGLDTNYLSCRKTKAFFLIDISILFPIWTFEGCCNRYTQTISI